ncbi:Abi protein [Helicobacter mustelae]|uniref:Abi family protein n=1 Tax=Helicobacter mustelae TaxID=217 RepID=UPI000E04E7FD|nr:Abi family protein [Helicobacter mustelae]STP11970.1 Abi protein [Helicobacter mustelae]
MNKTGQASKPKFSICEQISRLEEKGVAFSLCSKQEAEAYLKQNNYVFRIKSYAKNYEKSSRGRYSNLDFAYLIEFATIDLHFRRLVLSWSLDAEHHLKMTLLRHFNNNASEDGYSIVEDFLSKTPRVQNEILHKSQSSSFIRNLLEKYNDNLSLWNLLEVLDFGSFMEFFQFYFSKYSQDKKTKEIYSLAFSARVLRNASAHNNCMLNTLRIPYNKNFKPSSYINGRVSKIQIVSQATRKKLCTSPIMHDFLGLLFLLDEVCHSRTLKRARMKDLLSFLKRCKKHKEYFIRENFFTSRFAALAKIAIFMMKKSRKFMHF